MVTRQKTAPKKLKLKSRHGFSLKKLALFGGIFAVLGTSFVAFTRAATGPCYEWNNQESLQTVVDTNVTCINIAPGTYEMADEITVRSHTTVTINGNGAVFKAVRPVVAAGLTSDKWVEAPISANRSMFRSALATTLIMNNATLDGSNIVSYLGTAKNDSSVFKFDKMTFKNGACSAIGIFSPGNSLTNSTLTHNGHNCKVFSGIPEAAAIYLEKQTNGYYFSPVITGNAITDSFGPALDNNGVWGGTFSNNKVSGNTEWAAVSLYGASYWKITGNTISHPPTTAVQKYHPYCQPKSAAIGNRSAAIFLCQDTEEGNYLTNYNTIDSNSVSGGYGILLVGADEVKPYITPRLNKITNNSVLGSLYGCADDLKKNQWHDSNTWTNNNCLGKPNTAPATF